MIHSLELTPIPEKFYSTNTQSTPSLLTQSFLDKSEPLKQLLVTYYNNDPYLLLGEFQACFILFLVGENHEALEQHKKIFSIVTSIETYLRQNLKFALALIRVLYSQLSQYPVDFFLDILSRDNYLKEGLKSLVSSLSPPSTLPPILANRIVMFTGMIKERFGIGLEEYSVVDGEIVFEEDEEFRPVVVENPGKFINFDD